MLHSQRLLKNGAPKYVIRNASFFKQNCSKLSIYLTINKLFQPQTHKELVGFQQFMINVEKTLYYLQDQFESCAIEDVLNYLIPEFEDEILKIDDSIVKFERNEMIKRLSKYQHQFTSFKVSKDATQKNYLMGTKCPICTNSSLEAPPFEQGKTAN